ncbi:MAG: division/cell wall cluster transcriptional repressor MraZ [Rhodobiaceae bacterium]|nr:division/cell wall cluster transcriptional repressor MraZ [Rhodobiaceae bacterium]
MDQFVSNYTNRIDAKGRVSVPAGFRAILAAQGFDGVYCYPSLDTDAIEAGGRPLIEAIQGLIDALVPYSDERNQLATVLLGDGMTLSIDQDGRVTLPEALRAHAGLEGEVTFVGVGDKFFMWSPERYAAYRAEARSRARDLKALLGRRQSGEAAE